MPCVYHESPSEIQEREQRALNRQLEPLQHEIDVLKQELAERDAMLCGVLSSMFELDGYLGAAISLDGAARKFSYCVQEYFDEREAGVSWAMMEAWWVSHREQDRARKAVEAEAQVRKREAALAKLTPEERALLGLE
jgi:hypothetical protein